MLFLKNNTPYIGKLKLRFQKHPNYSSSNSILNAVYLNLGFTKLVSRMYPTKSRNGWVIDERKIAKICNYTGGTIKTYEWWEVRGTKGVFKTTQKPKNKKDIVYHGVLHNSFMYGDTYLGNLRTGWWYYKNRLAVCDSNPKGVAIKLKRRVLNTESPNILPENIEGVYGFSHRGGCLFRIGDRIFDASERPFVKDYTPKQWKEWHDKYRRKLKTADPFDKKWLCQDGVAGFIPFNMRGKKTIQTWDDAILAAKNLAMYLD